jgi:hypothetical protein
LHWRFRINTRLQKSLGAKRPERTGLEPYETSSPARLELGFAFFGCNALRFIVAVIAVLAFALAPD